MTSPPPARVRGNDWRSLPVAPPEAFEPARLASVIVPYYEAPDALALTLAGLERQTYPRELFEVIVVDDGSDPPLELAAPKSLRVQVIHQEDLGFGLARARNNGARAASGEILAFLDCDMIPEAGWLAAHARWHHAACDAVSLGFRRHVEVAGIDAQAVRDRPDSLAEVFAGRPAQSPQWIERRMARTDDLADGTEDIYRVVTGGNFAVSAGFFRRSQADSTTPSPSGATRTSSSAGGRTPSERCWCPSAAPCAGTRAPEPSSARRSGPAWPSSARRSRS